MRTIFVLAFISEQSKSMKKVRCAVIGLGRIGSLLEDDRLREKPCTHTGAIVQNDSCVLVAGCDIREDRCRLFTKRWGCDRVFTDAEKMLQAVKPEIVCIATPPDTHLELVMKAYDHHIPLVICEKPLANNSTDARSIARIHESGSMKIITNHERRYSSDYIRAKKMIQGKRLGVLRGISARVYMGLRRSVFDILLEDTTHLIDILHFLTDVRIAVGHAELFVDEDQESLFFIGSLETVPVHTEVASGRDHVVFEIDMSFTSGRIRIGNGLYEEYDSVPSPFYEGFRSLMRGPARRPRTTGYFKNMLEDAVRCVQDPDAAPVSSALDGHAAVHVIDTIKGMVAQKT